jgi:hypothetical protein
MGTNVAFKEYVAAATVAHSCRLLDMIPTVECGVTPDNKREQCDEQDING